MTVDAHQNVRSATALQILRHLSAAFPPHPHPSFPADTVKRLPLHIPPPPSWHSLAHKNSTATARQQKDHVRLALSQRIYRLPVDGKAADCRCSIADTKHARRFKRGEINVFLGNVFERLPAAVASAGLPEIELSRFCLHHAHIFSTEITTTTNSSKELRHVQQQKPTTRRLGMLFHSREYPAYHRESFPIDLGYCQHGSTLEYDEDGMGWRNFLWVEEGHIAAINVGQNENGDNNDDATTQASSSSSSSLLVMPGLEKTCTLLESDFGVPVADVYYINSGVGGRGRNKPQHSVFVFPR